MVTLAHNGVEIPFGDGTRRLRFSWAALIVLHDTWGEGYEARIGKAMRGRILSDLAIVIAAADIEGTLTPDDVIAASPPIFGVISAIELAWEWAQRDYASAQSLKVFIDAERAEAAAAQQEGKPQAQPQSWLSRFLGRFNFTTRIKTPSGQA